MFMSWLCCSPSSKLIVMKNFMRISSNNTKEEKRTLTYKLLQDAYETFKNSATSPFNTAEIWYIIDAKFYRQLGSLVSFYGDKTEEVEDLYYASLSICNHPLLEFGDSVPTVRSRLLSTAELGPTFLVCEESVWLKYSKIFKYDVAIPRSVYRTNKGTLKVECQPLKIYVYKFRSSAATTSLILKSADFSEWEISSYVITRGTQLCELLAQIKQQLGFGNSPTAAYFTGELIQKNGKKYPSILERLSKKEIEAEITIAEADLDEELCILAVSKFLQNTNSSQPETLAIQNATENLKEDENYNAKAPTEMQRTSSGRDYFGFFNFKWYNRWSLADSKQQISDQTLDMKNILESGGFVGLMNLGNTCFMNSAVQCLSKSLPLSKYFLNGIFLNDINEHNPLGHGGRLACAYFGVLERIWGRKESCFAPRELKQTIGQKREEFLGYQQQDSQELLSFLLDGLHEDLNRVKKKPYFSEKLEVDGNHSQSSIALSSWQRHKQMNDSVIVDLFQGQYRSYLECPQCSKISITFDPFMYLSLPIPKIPTIQLTCYISLNVTTGRYIHFQSIIPATCSAARIKDHICDSLLHLYGKSKSDLPIYLTAYQVDRTQLQTVFEQAAADIGLQSFFDLSTDQLLLRDGLRLHLSHRSPNFLSNKHTLLEAPFPRYYSSGIVSSSVFVWLLPRDIVSYWENPPLEEIDNSSVGVESTTADESSDVTISSLTTTPLNGHVGEMFMDENVSSMELMKENIAKKRRAEEKNLLYGILILPFVTNGNRYIIADSRFPLFLQLTAEHTLKDIYAHARKFYDSERERYSAFLYGDSSYFSSRKPNFERTEYTLYNVSKHSFVHPNGTASPAIEAVPNENIPILKYLKVFQQVSILFTIMEKYSTNTIELSRALPAISPPVVSIQDCLRLYSQTERLDQENAWYCNRCKRHVEASKKLDLYRLPQILIFHLKRFSKMSQYYGSKINTLVTFPFRNKEWLDMSPFVCNTTSKDSSSSDILSTVSPSKASLKYELFAVNCHSGSIGAGHYFAFTKFRQKWARFSDCDVEEAKETDVSSRDSYLLFFQRVEEENHHV